MTKLSVPLLIFGAFLVNRGECFGTVCGAVVGPNTSYAAPPRCRGQDSDEAGSLHGAELPKYLSLGVAGVDAAQAESCQWLCTSSRKLNLPKIGDPEMP